jgi:outer membrane protein TolC
LFDWGGAKVARAEAIYMQSVWQLHELAVNARSEARQAYYAYRATYDLSKHYRDEVVPLRKNIFDESLLRYNGMLIGTFELLADAREQITSVNNYIEFLLNFWLADTELQTAIMVRSPNNNTLAAITDNASNE